MSPKGAPICPTTKIKPVNTKRTPGALRLPEDLERQLSHEAELCGSPRSQLIREALEPLLVQRQRVEAALVAAAQALAANPAARAEALAVAADFFAAEDVSRTPPHTAQIPSSSSTNPSASSAPSSRVAPSSRCAIPCWPPRQISTARSSGSSSQPS